MGNYIKHGTGPNDHKKGNRTRGADRRGHKITPEEAGKDKTALLAANESRTQQVEHYKQIAKERAGMIRYGQAYAAILADNLGAYIIEKQKQHRPITKAGLIRASGLTADTYYRYRKGEADHLLFEYMDVHGIEYSREGERITTEEGTEALLCRLSDVIKMAELAMQEQLEENCYINKGNPLGSIAGMRNYFDWQENPQGNQTTNQTLVIAPESQIRAALDRLG